MSRINRDSQLSLGTKEIQVSEFLKTLIYLPAEQVRDFFNDLGLTIPREIRIIALREVLRIPVIETRKTRLTLADELNYRLSWFAEFTETQLENLLVFFDDRDLDKSFLQEFWTELINYMDEKGVIPETFMSLYEKSVVQAKANGLVLPTMKVYNRTIKDLFYDTHGRIDGLTLKKVRPVLYKSSTLGEIRDFGSKYDVDVPRRLKKDELAALIIEELKDRNKHTEALELEVKKMSVLLLQRFAIDNDIKASTELKKEEIIEYILKHAHAIKEAYFIPRSRSDYDMEVHEVSGKPAPVVEPVKPAVVEEVIEETVEVVVEQTVEVVVEETVEEVIEEPVQMDDVEEITEEPVIKEPISEVETIVEEVRNDSVLLTGSPSNVNELTEEVRKMRLALEKVLSPDEEEAFVEYEEKEPIILNTAEFYGLPKDYKRSRKVEDREIKKEVKEERQLLKEDLEDKVVSDRVVKEEVRRERQPAEMRVFGSIGRFFGGILKALLKLVLYVLIIGFFLFIIYAVFTKLVQIEMLDSINDTINGFKLGGKGILEHFHDFLGSLGL